MTRPLERSGIEELESIAANRGVTEEELFVLAEELSFRTTARAEKLLGQVQEALKTKQIFTRVRAKVAERKKQRQAQEQGSLDLGSPISSSSPAQRSEPLAAAEAKATTSVEAVKSVLPNLSTEQAYRLLKVPMLASWEQIEQSRRELVGRAQPDRLIGLAPDKRKALQDECRMVNAAYSVLLQTKT